MYQNVCPNISGKSALIFLMNYCLITLIVAHHDGFSCHFFY